MFRSTRIHSFDDARRLARRRLPWMVFDYIDGAAGSEYGAEFAAQAMRDIRLAPRVLRNVENRSIATRIFDHAAALPFGIAPMGMCNLAAPKADEYLARLAAKHTIPVGVSTVASTSLERMAELSEGNAWFQLYISGDRSGRCSSWLGTMGLASSIGLGVALAQKDKVIAIDGDGSVLTNFGTLPTIANNVADNFILLIIDNGSYGSTGDQPTYAGKKTSLTAVAKACGCETVIECAAEDCADVMKDALASDKMTIIVCKCESGNIPVPVITKDPVVIRDRFMTEIAARNG